MPGALTHVIKGKTKVYTGFRLHSATAGLHGVSFHVCMCCVDGVLRTSGMSHVPCRQISIGKANCSNTVAMYVVCEC